MKDTLDKVKMDASRKDNIRSSLMNSKAKTEHLGIKIAAAAAVLCIAAPLAVNAATGGELFDRLWGNSGKTNTTEHTITYIDEGKLDEDGNDISYPITLPGVEYVNADPDTADRLISGRITTEPVTCTVGNVTFTIESVVRDGMGVVVAYTIEQEGGVDFLEYDQLSNEGKGAWQRDDRNIEYEFLECGGKTWVDLERSTPDKLYCCEYMCQNNEVHASGSDIGNHITFVARELTMTRHEMWDAMDNGTASGFIQDEQRITIPVADKLNTRSLTSNVGDTIKISPIAMKWDTSRSFTFDNGIPMVPADWLNSITITYSDGSEYTVFDESNENCQYRCGTYSGGEIILFNRLVDTDNIAKITINDVEFTVS